MAISVGIAAANTNYDKVNNYEGQCYDKGQGFKNKEKNSFIRDQGYQILRFGLQKNETLLQYYSLFISNICNIFSLSLSGLEGLLQLIQIRNEIIHEGQSQGQTKTIVYNNVAYQCRTCGNINVILISMVRVILGLDNNITHPCQIYAIYFH